MSAENRQTPLSMREERGDTAFETACNIIGGMTDQALLEMAIELNGRDKVRELLADDDTVWKYIEHRRDASNAAQYE